MIVIFTVYYLVHYELADLEGALCEAEDQHKLQEDKTNPA